MIPASIAEDDSLDPALRAAFATSGEPTSGGTERPDLASGVAEMPGRYRVAGELARGGIGVILKGRDVDLGRDVALKVLRAEHAENPALTRRLVEEARIGGQLQHPGILPIYELGLDAARRPFFAMELVRGRSLADLLRERKSPDEDHARFLGIFEQLCHAMAYAHDRGVIHRDLKPANVMVGSFGEVQVVDWGLAKALAREEPPDETSDLPPLESPSISEVGSVLGTPAYMPPEQARGELELLDERGDVFGLGAILCEVLTGQPPFQGTRVEVLDRARAGRIEEAVGRLERSAAPEELIALAKRCLAPDREARPRDAGEVARVVRAHREALDARARAAELEAATARHRADAERRVRRLIVAMAGILLLASALGGMLYLKSEHQRRLAAEARNRADRAALELERERRARLESTLEILVPLNGKVRSMLLESAQVADRDLDRWAHLLGLLREIVARTAAGAPTEETRRQARSMAGELQRREAELRERLEKLGAPPRRP